jgi:molybdopterin converting factor small subunit
MNVSVQFRGPIARQIEGGMLEIEIEEGLALKDLLIRMLEQSSYLQNIWREPSEVDRDSMILYNGVDSGVTGGLETVLKDGDTLILVPLVHGG